MKLELHEFLVSFGLLFCRVGACVMLLPGLSSNRVPASARLFLSMALALALLPLGTGATSAPKGPDASSLAFSIFGEIFIGAFIGIAVRIFYLALEFTAAAAANFSGYGSIFDQAIDDAHLSGPYSEFITLTALVLFFIMDLHVAVFTLLGTSLASMPAGSLGPTGGLEAFNEALRISFTLSVQLSAPLIAYAIVLNVGFGLLNKLMPQVPIYFISAPFAMVGGLLILFQSNGAIFRAFISGLGDWIGRMASFG